MDTFGTVILSVLGTILGLIMILTIIVACIPDEKTVKFTEIQYDKKYDMTIKTADDKEYYLCQSRILQVDDKGKPNGKVGVEKMKFIEMLEKFGEFSVAKPPAKNNQDLNSVETSDKPEGKTSQVKIERTFKKEEIQEITWMSPIPGSENNSVIGINKFEPQIIKIKAKK